MENIATDVISLLQYLLPGFLTAWVFYGFTSFEKPDKFERVIQALIFTLIIQTLVLVISVVFLWVGEFFSFGVWTENSDLFTSIIVAVWLGFVFAYCSNTDKFHKQIRKFGLSRETSYPSEWFGLFFTNVTYVVLHLRDGRRIYGWPIEWPSSPNRGHFALEQASWLVENSEPEKQQVELPLLRVESILIAASDVQMVEFMSKTWEEPSNEKVV